MVDLSGCSTAIGHEAKAAEIEKACRIRMGQEGLCNPDISDGLTYVQLSNGMVVSKRMAKEMGIL